MSRGDPGFVLPPLHAGLAATRQLPRSCSRSQWLPSGGDGQPLGPIPGKGQFPGRAQVWAVATGHRDREWMFSEALDLLLTPCSC